MCKGSLPPDPRAALERLRDDYRTKWQKHQEQRKSATDHFHMGYEEGEEYAYRTAASDLTAILDAWPQGEPMVPVRVMEKEKRMREAEGKAGGLGLRPRFQVLTEEGY